MDRDCNNCIHHTDRGCMKWECEGTVTIWDVKKKQGVKVTERGWAGHLCVASSCGFRRNTLLEYKDKKWIVSTVGAYRNIDGKMDAIALNRYYETMAFVGTEQDGYIDADVMQEIGFNSEWGMWGSSWEEIREKYPHPDNHANDMHEKVVAELISKIVKESDGE